MQHLGIGNALGKVYARSMRRLPNINSINLKDNKLGDKGLAPLISAIASMPQLLSLDLSMNDVDGKAAAELAEYLARPACPLLQLVINNADVDDEECLRFVAALSRNKTLTTLSLAVLSFYHKTIYFALHH